jgi:cell division protein FtsN
MKRLCVFAAALALAATARAQDSASTSTVGVDSVLQRAEAMVDAGRAAAGRALVDSVLTAATPGTEAYAEALYARGSLASTAGDAERDYLRITVEYSLSPRSPDALLRLAQLELARGDRTQARAHLTRLTEDRPADRGTGGGEDSVARAYQELGDQPHACAALLAAQQSAAPSDVELRNQIDYAARPCPTAPATSTATPTATPTPTTTKLAAAAAAPPNAPTTVVVVPPPAADTPATPAAAAAKAAFATPTTTPKPSTPPPAPTPAPASAPAPAPAKGGGYTIQVAAYATRGPADALAAKLTARGLPARVWGTAAPFRVRVGRYPTHAAAESAAADLKSKQIEGFVTDAER